MMLKVKPDVKPEILNMYCKKKSCFFDINILYMYA